MHFHTWSLILERDLAQDLVLWRADCIRQEAGVNSVFRKKSVFVLIAALMELWTAPKGRAQQYACSPAPPSADYKTLRFSAQTDPIAIVSGTLQYKNDDRVWIMVQDINPFVATYTLKVKRQPVTETAVTTFLSALGGIDSGIVPTQKSPSADSQKVQTPTPALTPAPADRATPATPTCDRGPLDQLVSKFKALDDEEKKINAALAAIAAKYTADGNTVSGLLETVKKEHLCAGIQASAVALRQFLTTAVTESPDQIKAADFGQSPVADDPTKVLQGSIDQLAQDAKTQRRAILDYRKSAAGRAECAAFLDANAKLLDDEDDFIDGLIGPTARTPEVQALTAQLSKLKATYQQWSDAHSAVEKLFDPARSGNPFVLTYPLTDSQSDDEVTVQASPAVLASSATTGGGSTSGGSSAKTSSAPPPALDTTLHFGFGPRFTLSGGLVVSFLENRQFTTANGEIAYQNNSQTRILPMALLNSRFHDCDSDHPKCLVVPQISVGITAKADDKGTAPEYLIGPSWAFVKRQLFITVGAYAGQQQRLLGGLQVGQTTSLSAANLPIAKEYHWSAAIALSWKIK
jgi:hypothetical protein